MKRILIAILAGFVLLLSGCAAPGAPLTPAEVQANLAAQVKKACAVVQPTIVSLQAQSSQLTADQVTDLAKASDLAAKVCSAPTVAVPTSIADFVQAAFPVVIKIVDASPLLPQDKALASIALTAAQIGLSAALAQ